MVEATATASASAPAPPAPAASSLPPGLPRPPSLSALVAGGARQAATTPAPTAAPAAAAAAQRRAAARPAPPHAVATAAAAAAARAAPATAGPHAAPGARGSASGGASASSSSSRKKAKPARWQKVLWKAQPFPDNHTDATFLRDLVVNADVPLRDAWQVFLGSASVAQQASVVAAAAAVPVHLRRGSLAAPAVLAACGVLLGLGYAVCCAFGGHVLGGSPRRGARQAALLAGGVYLLAPLLHSLARTVSQDSVAAMAAGLLLAHLFLHDYNFLNSATDRLAGALSLGGAVLASVLVASTLPSTQDVFAHVLLCLELYLLSPYMRRYIRQASTAAHLALTAAMALAAAALLLPLSAPLAALFLSAVVGVSGICPRWLVRIHKFKAKINGPWDEAVPDLSSFDEAQRQWQADGRRQQQLQQLQQQQQQREQEQQQAGAGAVVAAAAAAGAREAPGAGERAGGRGGVGPPLGG